MRLHQRRLRLALAVLLASAAVLLAAGTIAEHHQPTEQAQPTALTVTGANGQTDQAGKTSGEASEQGGEGGGEGGAAGATHPPVAAGGEHAAGERFLGVAESLPLTIVAAGISLALALAVWARPARPVIWIALLAVLVLAAADGRELAHHLHEARAGLATIAGVLLGVHLAAGGVAALLAMRLPAASRAAVNG